jgi:hypothetical protein
MNGTEMFVQYFLEFICLRLLFESNKWALNLDLAECKNLFRNRLSFPKGSAIAQEVSRWLPTAAARVETRD